MATFLIIIGGIAILVWWYNDRTSRTATQDNTSTPRLSAPEPAATLDDSYTLEIVGESNYQAALIAIFGPYTKDGVSEYCGAELAREPTNKFDKNAVRCEIAGQLVGYVNKSEAADVAKHLKRKKIQRMSVNADVKGGWSRGFNDQGMYGVTVDVAPEVLDPDAK